MAMPTVIIGAGVGGLTTGAILVNNGHKVMVLEKSGKLGGRTTSMEYKNHILDNGFHIMPFYKKSAIFTILKNLGIESRLKLAKVDDIAFYADTGFHIYPKGMMDLLKLSLIPFKSRVRLLKLLLPLAFSSIEKTELWDEVPLTKITNNLDSDTNAFFEAVCMLAFADTADHISLGEFARTIIRANPFKGGTSEFAYPDGGGYDSICRVLGDFILEKNGDIQTKQSVKKVIVENSKVTGVVVIDSSNSEKLIPTNSVVISYPAYTALNQLFDENVIDKKLKEGIKIKLVYLEVDANKADVLGNEPVYHNNEIVGLTTSGAYGFRVNKSLAFAYVNSNLVKVGTEFLIDIQGQKIKSKIIEEPAFDPKNLRLKS
jgi:phytoene dehydrogenase-like protein